MALPLYNPTIHKFNSDMQPIINSLEDEFAEYNCRVYFEGEFGARVYFNPEDVGHFVNVLKGISRRHSGVCYEITLNHHKEAYFTIEI